jgi:ubiquinone/menaquinone biosynthesis C-methylase UbiE
MKDKAVVRITPRSFLIMPASQNPELPTVGARTNCREVRSAFTSGSVRSNLQRHFYEEKCDPEFEIVRPRGCGRLYEFLIEAKFRMGLKMLRLPIAHSNLLEVCAGSGMMAEKFVRSGANVTASDFSPAAVNRMRERANRYDFHLDTLVADAENLPFVDRHFDIVTVHDGLHHLENPMRAIREMARVARRGVLIMDPARAALTQVAVRLGFAQDIEEAGNVVKRLEPRAVAAELSECGFKDIRWQRSLMYYPHEPGRLFRWFDNDVAFTTYRALFAAINLVSGSFGNKLALAATSDLS